ncbi:MAG: hypothetical protein NTV00_01275 [Methylococcales bacterium]|nr:hypothetical protein [Methylococcales bacterium]
MKLPRLLKTTFVVVTMLLSGSVFAYSTDAERKEECKPPKMLEFTLPEYSQPERLEVKPESEFSFKLSGGTAAEDIQVYAKQKLLPVVITKNTSFMWIKGKLPAELTGKFVRLDVIVKTELGCRSRDGWLVKVADQ